MRAFWTIATIHDVRLFDDGSIFDHTGGTLIGPKPPPVPSDNLLLEDGNRVLMENGNYVALES